MSKCECLAEASRAPIQEGKAGTRAVGFAASGHCGASAARARGHQPLGSSRLWHCGPSSVPVRRLPAGACSPRLNECHAGSPPWIVRSSQECCAASRGMPGRPPWRRDLPRHRAVDGLCRPARCGLGASSRRRPCPKGHPSLWHLGGISQGGAKGTGQAPQRSSRCAGRLFGVFRGTTWRLRDPEKAFTRSRGRRGEGARGDERAMRVRKGLWIADGPWSP